MEIRPANPNAVENQFDEWTKAVARGPSRRKILQLLSGGLVGACLALRGSNSWAQGSTSSAAPTATTPSGAKDHITAASAQKGLSICRNQEYALCTGALCFVYNDVAYCRCNVLSGTSVSRTQSYPGGDVCNFNAEGHSNGFVVSTFSVPSSSVKAAGNQALYSCPPKPNSGAYATCDGGICFASTRGKSFPGLGQLAEDQIVCACPIAHGTSGPAAVVGHQIFGPHPCEASFFENCTSAVATGANGTHLYEGATTGSYEVGAAVLDGGPAHFNMCLP